MADDDWRLRIEFGDDGSHGRLLGVLSTVDADAHELAKDLETRRLAVTQDDNTVFVYAGTQDQIAAARSLIESELQTHHLEPILFVTEHWLSAEDRWDDEPATGPVEEEAIESGYAPWEVRIPCRSHHEARELADQLEQEGHGVVRRWRYVIAGVASEEEAGALATRLHGEAMPGGEFVYETAPRNPFAILGGLGSDGTPL